MNGFTPNTSTSEAVVVMAATRSGSPAPVNTKLAPDEPPISAKT
jgi:hypothetical protein